MTAHGRNYESTLWCTLRTKKQVRSSTGMGITLTGIPNVGMDMVQSSGHDNLEGV